jgi:electron transport complex protein RnfD
MHKPQINVSYSSSARMWLVCACAFFCVLQSAINDGGRSLVPVITALFTSLLLEFLFTWRDYRVSKIKDGSTAASAVILCLMLPNTIHPVYAAFGAAFAVIVVKLSFGGLGSNWLNPALGGWLFIRFSWPAAFADVMERHASSISEMNALAEIGAADNSLTGFLNNSVFSITNIQLPSGYINLLFNGESGFIVDRGIFALLIGTIIITAAGVNRGWIPLVFLAVYGFLVRLAGDLSGEYWNGDLLYGFFSGGTIAAAFILAAEPSSGAKLMPGVILTVIAGALLSWFFRYKCMDYTGCFTALALVNCFTPLVKFLEEKYLLSGHDDHKFDEEAKENIL